MDNHVHQGKSNTSIILKFCQRLDLVCRKRRLIPAQTLRASEVKVRTNNQKNSSVSVSEIIIKITLKLET